MTSNNASNINIDALLVAASGVLAENNARYLGSLDVSAIQLSPKADRKISDNINKGTKNYKPPVFYRQLCKVATILLVICIATLTLCMSVEAVRAELWKSIVTFFDDHIGIHLEASDMDTPEIILTKREPSLQPSGTAKTVLVDFPINYFIMYTTDNTRVVTFQQTPLTQQPIYTDNDCIISQITINGNNAELIEYFDSDKCYMILWFDGEYRYMLDSWSETIGVEELVAIAESVK